METTNKNSKAHGGKRTGAGRPKGSGKGRTVKTICICLPPAAINKIDERRRETSRSRFIADVIAAL